MEGFEAGLQIPQLLDQLIQVIRVRGGFLAAELLFHLALAV